ncbi:uncharacterized protein AtWU_10112 [Aspergillus tubingensis]|uniref:uncharacterized protein n=1 Tax=Aspergillus tubingensis TaxID=5068 RepID=UPI0015792CD0|nr:uncharacterized protein AtWU_10112 [Aspergillus tubingensis]GFN20306.1 hypothetical protein AtWU_10112 [Aspergillus tubingensis]GLB23645.1 hypothetical protein AtubIFM61612_004242 [Aspergillus tubingensis]
MSGFIHKAEDALHLHHHKDKAEHKHEDAHEHPPTIGREGHEHTHRSHPPQNKHMHPHPNEEQIARDDFRSDREYDRALRSPHHGPGIGFEA